MTALYVYYNKIQYSNAKLKRVGVVVVVITCFFMSSLGFLAVTHPSTNRAQCWLTTLIEAVVECNVAIAWYSNHLYSYLTQSGTVRSLPSISSTIQLPSSTTTALSVWCLSSGAVSTDDPDPGPEQWHYRCDASVLGPCRLTIQIQIQSSGVFVVVNDRHHHRLSYVSL